MLTEMKTVVVVPGSSEWDKDRLYRWRSQQGMGLLRRFPDAGGETRWRGKGMQTGFSEMSHYSITRIVAWAAAYVALWCLPRYSFEVFFVDILLDIFLDVLYVLFGVHEGSKKAYFGQETFRRITFLIISIPRFLFAAPRLHVTVPVSLNLQSQVEV